MCTIITREAVLNEYYYQIALSKLHEINKYDMIRSLGRTLKYLEQHHIRDCSSIATIKSNLILSKADADTLDHLLSFWNVYWNEAYTYEAICQIIYAAEPAKHLTPKITAKIIKNFLKMTA